MFSGYTLRTGHLMASSVQNNKVPTPLTVACPVMPTLPGSNETLRTQTCLPQSGLPVCISPKTSVSTVRPSGIRSRLQGLCRGEQWVPSNPSSAAFARHDESGCQGAAAPTEGAGRLGRFGGVGVPSRWIGLSAVAVLQGGSTEEGCGMWTVIRARRDLLPTINSIGVQRPVAELAPRSGAKRAILGRGTTGLTRSSLGL